MPQISEKAKSTIDALSKVELIDEVEKGRKSRFQREKFDYVKERLAKINENGQQQRDSVQQEIAENLNQEDPERHKYTKVGLWIGALTLIVAMFTFVAQISSNAP